MTLSDSRPLPLDCAAAADTEQLRERLRDTAAVILAAGHGTRMRTSLPKVLHPLAGLPVLGHVLRVVRELETGFRVTVVSPALADHTLLQDEVTTAQDTPRGTGDAVRKALEVIPGRFRHILVLCADTPLLTPQTLLPLFGHDNALLTLRLTPDQSAMPYGRVIGEPVSRIVEYRDATEEEKNIPFANSGMMLLSRDIAQTYLPRLEAANSAGEYYLTDVIGMAAQAGHRITAVEADAQALHGINTLADLAEAERVMQERLRRMHMLAGVRITDPSSVRFNHDTKIAADCVLEHDISFGAQVNLGARTRVLPFCRLEGVSTGEDVTIGPFAHLRPGTVMEDKSAAGNFVEIKNTLMGAGAKAKHLSYLGDSNIGAKTNIGAGTVTCNYDGVNKHGTVIGSEVFVGANSTLVAPLDIADGAVIAAGSVITEDVAADTLAFGRTRQCNKPGGAVALRRKIRGN